MATFGRFIFALLGGGALGFVSFVLMCLIRVSMDSRQGFNAAASYLVFLVYVAAPVALVILVVGAVVIFKLIRPR